MKVERKEVSEIKREMGVTLPAEQVDQALDRVYAKISKKAKVKGFRPGKVPRSFLEQYYREDAEKEAMEELVHQSYGAALEEAGIRPVAPPSIQVMVFGPGQDFQYEAHIEEKPVIVVKEYEGLQLVKQKSEATAEEILGSLKGLQERLAQVIPVAEMRQARNGDMILIDYQILESGIPLLGFSAKDYLGELGNKALLPELEVGLVGMNPGETKRVSVTFPAELPEKKLAGKKLEFEVLLKEIREKKLPNLDDEFAKDLGPFQTLEEVKEKVKEQIIQDKERKNRDQLKRSILEKLILKNEFPVPDSLVEMELQGMWDHLQEQLKNQGVTLEQAGLRKEDFLEQNRSEALFRVKGLLLFDALAQKENIGVTREEMERAVEEMARVSGQSLEVWKRHYDEKNAWGHLEVMLREEKILDFVLTQSKIKVEG